MWYRRSKEILRICREILVLILEYRNRVLSLRMVQLGEIMTSFAPGYSPEFQIVVAPTNATTVPTGFALVSSDPTNVIATQNLTADPTGSTFTVTIVSGASVGEIVTLTATYTNADGTSATLSITETVVAPPPPSIDVTSITAINQVV